MNRKLLLAALVASAFTASNAIAATAFDDFEVKIVLVNSCTITADDLDFGSTSALTADIDASTQVHVTCSAANPVSIAFNPGTGSPSVAGRVLTSGANNTVSYNLYPDTSYATPLGDTAGTTLDFTSAIGANDKTVYGRVPVQTLQPVGTYVSTVIATVTF